MKGPALNQLLTRLGTRQQNVEGYRLKNKQICVLSGLLLLFTSSLMGIMLMWFSSIFENAVYSNLVLANGSDALEMFKNPSPKAFVKFYIFNYTNLESYKTNFTEKLHVDEVGPYVYEETFQRVNLKFNDDNTISFQEKRTYVFQPDLSNGRQSDKVIVPNVLLLSAASTARFSSYFARLSLSGMLSAFSEETFLTLPVQSYIFGYEDDLYRVSKPFLKMREERPTEKMGLFANKVGISPDIVTVNSGIEDVSKTGVIERINNQLAFDYWSTEDCNSFRASDGITFAPKTIKAKEPVTWFQKQMCRAMPMVFDRETKILSGKVPAYRYVLPVDVFDTPDKKKNNQCFCNMDSGECPVQGTFNTTPCLMGAPLFVSFPHFFNADEALKTAITGLNPNPEYEMYANIHPTMGFLMSGSSKFQGNVKMTKISGIGALDMFKEDELMLPLSWIDVVLEDQNLPADFVNIIYQTTFTVKGVELALKYGCILTSFVTIICVYIILKNSYSTRERTASVLPLQRTHIILRN